jgi:hypothetical protein
VEMTPTDMKIEEIINKVSSYGLTAVFVTAGLLIVRQIVQSVMEDVQECIQ